MCASEGETLRSSPVFRSNLPSPPRFTVGRSGRCTKPALIFYSWSRLTECPRLMSFFRQPVPRKGEVLTLLDGLVARPSCSAVVDHHLVVGKSGRKSGILVSRHWPTPRG